jgi:hypothetical protein
MVAAAVFFLEFFSYHAALVGFGRLGLVESLLRRDFCYFCHKASGLAQMSVSLKYQ